MNFVWFGIGFIIGLVLMRYMRDKEFKDKINESIKNLFKKKS